jgi:hypothetical protein
MGRPIGKGGISQRVMQPTRPEPAVALVGVDVHRVRPAVQERDDPLDMGASLG